MARSCTISSRRAGNISVHVIAGEEIEGEPIPRKTVRAADKPPSFDLRAYVAALLAVAAAVGVGRAVPAVDPASRTSICSS